MTRDEIVVSIWPERGGKQAKSLFHSTLHRIRRALYRECLVEAGGAYALQPTGTFTFDAQEFLHLTERARGLGEGHDGIVGIMRQAVRMYHGPFAPLLESEWAQSHRMKLEERFSETAGRLSAHLLKDGDYAGVLEVSEALLNSYPYNETAVYELMQAHAALGDGEGAIRAYRRYSDLLELELGVEPGYGLQELHREIRGRAEETPLKPQ